MLGESKYAPNWEARCAAKADQLEASLPKEWLMPASVIESFKLKEPLWKNKNNLIELDIPRRSGILSDKEYAIIQTDTPTLLKKLASGEFTALETTVAFCKTATVAQQMINCLTETFFDQALERARELDRMCEKGCLAGPLHGLPISLKDTFLLEGIGATLGMVFLLDNIATENSALVDLLLDQGAIHYVKTNVPQTMLSADSHNLIFGRTLNPQNTMLGAGGSSGGEGALVAFRGSPLGVGTDLGGSIRIPAFVNGCYGFKGTASRVPYGKQQIFMNPGLKFMSPVAGPIANDLDTLKIFSRIVSDARPFRYDYSAINIPWRVLSTDQNRRLRLGVVSEDQKYPLHPSTKKVLADAYARLEAAGHILIRLTPEECRIAEISEVMCNYPVLDKSVDRIVELEPAVPGRERLMSEFLAVKKDYIKPENLVNLTPIELWGYLNTMGDALLEDWRKLWVKYNLDACVGPPAQGCAIEHDLFGMVPYTCFLNLLNYPACVIPFSKVEYIPDATYEVKEGQAGPPWNAKALEGTAHTFQVFTPSYQDEECLEISGIIDKCLNGHVQ